MMTHDPYQNFQASGAYFGGPAPYGLPYAAYPPSFNPMGFAGQPQANPGIGGYGIYPNPLLGGTAGQIGPLHQLLALNSLTAGLQHPLLQHPLLQHVLAQSSWQNQQPGNYGWPQQPQQQYGYPQAAQQSLPGPVGIGQPFGFGQQLGYPLAPQTLIGAGGIGQAFGQVHPLAQLALRQAAGYGNSPWAGGF
jgi:hypothetical protein